MPDTAAAPTAAPPACLPGDTPNIGGMASGDARSRRLLTRLALLRRLVRAGVIVLPGRDPRHPVLLIGRGGSTTTVPAGHLDRAGVGRVLTALGLSNDEFADTR